MYLPIILIIVRFIVVICLFRGFFCFLLRFGLGFEGFVVGNLGRFMFSRLLEYPEFRLFCQEFHVLSFEAGKDHVIFLAVTLIFSHLQRYFHFLGICRVKSGYVTHKKVQMQLNFMVIHDTNNC